MDSSESVDLNAVKIGLLSDPKYISAELLWACKHAQTDFEKRKLDNPGYYKLEHHEIKECAQKVGKSLPNKVTIVDLGASVSRSTTVMLETFVESNPDLEICYVPNDMSDIICTWREHLQANFPKLNERVVHIEPVVGDMLETVKTSDDLLCGTEWQQWNRIYAIFGPTTAVLEQNYFINLIKTIATKVTENGGVLFSYMQEIPNLQEQMHEVWESKIDLESYYKSFIEGFSEVTDADLDSDCFDYKDFYLTDQTTPGIDGTWGGKQIKAFAKKDIQFTCGKLENLKVTLKKAEPIRLSLDVVKTYHYSSTFIESMAKQCGLKVENSTLKKDHVMICNFLTHL